MTTDPTPAQARAALAKKDAAQGRAALAAKDQGTAEPHVTPTVRAEAQKYGVDLKAVTATGAGGRVSLKDVRAAAERSGKRPAAASRVLAAATAPRGPAYARNPLVDQLLRARPEVAAKATQPRPTLFHSGDLPPFTASGIDPSALLTVPWQARHAVAAAPTTDAAFRLLELYADDPEAAELELGPSGVYMTSDQPWLTPAPNLAYARRVDEWAASAMTDDELMSSLFGHTGTGLTPSTPRRTALAP